MYVKVGKPQKLIPQNYRFSESQELRFFIKNYSKFTARNEQTAKVNSAKHNILEVPKRKNLIPQ